MTNILFAAMKKTSIPLLTAFVLAASPAFAAEYFVVVPVKGRTAEPPADSITVSLQSATLPPAMVGQTYSYNLRDHLLITGDNVLDLNQATLTTADTLPAGLSLAANGVLSGTPSTIGASTIAVKAAYKSKMAQQYYSVTVVGAYSSCSNLLAAVPGTASGWHTLDVDGLGPVPAQSYYCDMSSDGGGWTRVVKQLEYAPVTNWNGGVNGDSYTVAASAIPAHSQTAFGINESATAVDYVNFVYTTSNIPKTLVSSPKTGKQYHIHRDTASYWGAHDPESTLHPDAQWLNTLTFDATGGSAYTWAFSPNYGVTSYRGFSLNGAHLYTNNDFMAWSVWVR